VKLAGKDRVTRLPEDSGRATMRGSRPSELPRGAMAEVRSPFDDKGHQATNLKALNDVLHLNLKALNDALDSWRDLTSTG
jgi:hypothetical protein